MESTFRDTCPSDLKVIETFASGPDGAAGWAAHHGRLRGTCERLGIAVDHVQVAKVVANLRFDAPQRVRLTVDLDGQIDETHTPMAATPEQWTIGLAAAPVDAQNPWFGVKTTQRAIYDDARAHLPVGVDELIFVNSRGHVTEGTITNIFVQKGGVLLTPPLNDGVLPGILRAKMIADGRTEVAHLTWDDVTASPCVYVGNALRGLIKAAVRV